MPNLPNCQRNAASVNHSKSGHRRTGASGGVSGQARGAARPPAVVVTVTITVTGVAPSVADDGETEHMPSGIVPLQLMVTVPLKPPDPLKLSWKLADWPAVMVAVVGEPVSGATEKSVPVPVNEI